MIAKLRRFLDASSYFTKDGKPALELQRVMNPLFNVVEAAPRYLEWTHDFDTAASGTQVKGGTIPFGARVLWTHIAVLTAFDAAGSNSLKIGTVADDDALVADTSVTEGAIGSQQVLPATLAGLLSSTVDTPVYSTFTQTGTAATTGRAVILIAYK